MTKLLVNKQTRSLTRGFKSFLLILSLSLLFASCEKEAGQIGYIIQPEDSRLDIGYSDTSSVYGYSIPADSVRSDKLTSSALGVTNDPVFGSTKASFYTTFNLSINEKDFGDNPTLDSLVLQLYYQGAYGDTNNTLSVNVFEMTGSSDTLSSDSSYYSNLQMETASIDYSDYSFQPRPNDSVYFDDDTLAPMIRINLSDVNTSLGNRLVNATETEMLDTDSFRESILKGLYVTVDDLYGSDGTFAYFGLSSSYSKMIIYYHNDSEDTLSYDYNINTSTPTVGIYDHNFTTGDFDFQQQVVNGDTSLGKQILYTQGFGGTKTILKFPHIYNWARKGNVAVNEAKLILPAAEGASFYGEPAQLTLLKIDEDGELSLLVDYSEGTSYFDGYYDEDRDQYEFRITRYIQSMISDTTQVNNGLSLQVYGASTVPERFIIKGSEISADSTAGMRLELLYTDL